MPMKNKLSDILNKNKIQTMRVHIPVLVTPESSIKDVIAKLQQAKQGCAVVHNQEKIAGIFTERDLLTRVLGPGLPLSTAVGQVMTGEPTCLRMDDLVATAIGLMSSKGFRHIPLVNEQGRIQGVLSVRGVLDYLAEHFPYQIYNLPPDPHKVNDFREGA